MKEFNLPLFMKVKPDALKELKDNLDLYFPDILCISRIFSESGF